MKMKVTHKINRIHLLIPAFGMMVYFLCGIIIANASYSSDQKSTSVVLSNTNVLSLNLISNPGVETVSNNPTVPGSWTKGGYGTNDRSFTYPATGNITTKGVKITITSFTSGDAKWFFDEVPVVVGHTYTFSDFYSSNISSIVTVRFTLNDGSFRYKDVGFIQATQQVGSSSLQVFQNTSATFVAPSNAVSATIFHLINQIGSLTTDDYSLKDTTPPPDSQGQTNLIPNPGFEQTDAFGNPAYWKQGGWGMRSNTFSYPINSIDGSRAARVDISSFVYGDSKWYFTPLSLSPGTYTYSDQYISDEPSTLTVQYQNTDGSYTYKDIGYLAASVTATSSYARFYVPYGVQNVTVYHLIKGMGYLTIDNTVVRLESSPTGIFKTGAITFRFDDGWLSQYQNALPKLDSAGFKATFFIISHQLSDYGFTDYMSTSTLQSLYADGQEIGAHTRTHTSLSSLTLAQQQDEIAGSRQDLLAMNIGPILSFAYPFGNYTSDTIHIVRNAQFAGATASLTGYATPTSDPYQLERLAVTASTSVSEIKSWIDTTMSTKKWLIIELHEINTSGNLYSITPTNFDQIVDYIAQKQVPVVTISQGLQYIQK